MKKVYSRLPALVLFVLLFCSVVLDVRAHSGRTDGSGGHTDSDTGEYHYHHGYPAHDHYDMDGDGVADCPYVFDDQANHNQVTSNSSYTDPDIDISEVPTANNAKRITITEVLKAMLESLLPAIAIGIAASHLLTYLFFLLFGNDKGCLITSISFVAISIIAYILLIIYHFS